MKELEGMMQNGDLENVLGGLMDQIMSKELLHEPMKDLADKVTTIIPLYKFIPNSTQYVFKRMHLYCLLKIKLDLKNNIKLF